MSGRKIRYAGFWRRSTAFILDYILFNSLFFFILYLLHGSDYLQWLMRMERGLAYGPMDALLNYVIFPGIVILFWMKISATPGKLLLSCVVVDAQTLKPMQLKQAILRFFAYFVSFLPLFLGFIWVAWDSRKQGFHDKIARTVVIVEDEADRLLQQWREYT